MKDKATHCPLHSAEHAALLLDYSAGRLTEEVRLRLEAHLVHCPQCRELVAGQQAVWRALDDFEPDTIDAGFGLRLEREAERRARLGWSSRLGSFFRGISWKPAIPAAAVLALWVMMTPPATQPIAHHEDAPNAEQVEQTLEDLDMLQQIRLNG